MSRVLWYLRQLLPLTYRTFYRDSDGRHHFVVWRMWLGRCFDETDVVISDPTSLTMRVDTREVVQRVREELDRAIRPSPRLAAEGA